MSPILNWAHNWRSTARRVTRDDPKAIRTGSISARMYNAQVWFKEHYREYDTSTNSQVFSDIHSKEQGLLQEIAKKHSSQLFITHKDFIVKQFVDASFPWQTRAHSWYPNHDTPTMPSEPQEDFIYLHGQYMTVPPIEDKGTWRKFLLRTLMSNCESRLSVSMFRCDYWGDKNSDPTLSSPTRTNLITKQT